MNGQKHRTPLMFCSLHAPKKKNECHTCLEQDETRCNLKSKISILKCLVLPKTNLSEVCDAHEYYCI